MDKEVDIEEIKRTLKDANMYDSNLTSDELKSYYMVLKNSESTANEEEETRKLNKTIEIESASAKDTDDSQENLLTKEGQKPFIPKSWSSLKNKITENKQKTICDEIINALEDKTKHKDATKTIFGFNDMETFEQSSFNIIRNNLKFIPIQCTETFLKADLKNKAKIIYSYHSELHAIQAHLARQSLLPAPLPKAVVSINQFSISTENNYDNSQTYVSRSGRQTKRKIYNYDENSLDDDFQCVINKRTKNEELEWSDKSLIKKNEHKAKLSDKPASSSNGLPDLEKEITGKTLDDLERHILSEEEKVDAMEITKSEDTIYDSTPKSTSKRLSNSEIMKRSKLFRDTSKKGSRRELLFDKVVEETEIKQKEEKAMNDFEKTLELIDVNDEESAKDAMADNENIIVVDVEEPKKRRVIPPIPGRKLINKRSNTSGLTPLSIVIESLSPKGKERSNSMDAEETVASPKSKRRNTGNKKNTRAGSPKKNAASTSQNNTQQCPICENQFPTETIQKHAATCGDEADIVTRSSSRISKITCEICDAVIPLSTEYEVHVKDCIQAKQLSENK